MSYRVGIGVDVDPSLDRGEARGADSPHAQLLPNLVLLDGGVAAQAVVIGEASCQKVLLAIFHAPIL